MLDPVDGLKLELSSQLSPFFQLGGGWVYPNKENSSFNIFTAIATEPSSPDTNFISSRYDGTGKMEVQGTFRLPFGFGLRGEMFFPDNDVNKAQIALEFQKHCKFFLCLYRPFFCVFFYFGFFFCSFFLCFFLKLFLADDSYMSLKSSSGMYSFTMMQTLFKNCFTGFETCYIVCASLFM